MIDSCYPKCAAAVLLLCACAPEAAEADRAPRPPPAQTGTASYYGPEFAGRSTASGEPHDPRDITAASRTLPLGTKARVTHKETGRSVAVEVNDRGPHAKGRILDVSPKAAERLGMKDDGVAPVEVQPLAAPKPDAKAAD